MKTGEIIKLGDHRLICGDCQDPKIVAKLIGKDKIRVVLTDPPYGIDYSKKNEYLNKIDEGNRIQVNIINDEINKDYIKFTQKWIEPIIKYLESYNAFYIFNSGNTLFDLKKGIDKTELYFSQLIIWVKNNIVLGRKDYNPQHELIVYGWHGRHKFERSKKKSVVFYPRPHRAKLHPTMKPVGLIRKLILNSTKIKEIIYDPFGGSGSMLIACEQTKRKCLMIELDGEYCEVIKNRYSRYMAQFSEKTEN